jgi:hypothetical protein
MLDRMLTTMLSTGVISGMSSLEMMRIDGFMKTTTKSREAMYISRPWLVYTIRINRSR